MTLFAVYIVIYMALNIAASLFYAGVGRLESTTGTLLFSAVWCALNLTGLLFFGFPAVF